jgi:uncharacterized protein
MNECQEKYINIAKGLVLKHVDKDKYAVFIFGSRAEGTNLSNSDIDIGFLGNDPISTRILSKINKNLRNQSFLTILI